MPPIPLDQPAIPAFIGTRVNGANRQVAKTVDIDLTRLPDHVYTPNKLATWGFMRAAAFCKANAIRPVMSIYQHPKAEWEVEPCAYWRSSTCHICVDICAVTAKGEHDRRNWNWPGTVTDRTPYGVICHELGHHVDYHGSDPDTRGRYFGALSHRMMEASGEKAITSYAPNPAEWFAEMFRVFVTNHALLYKIRPRTWHLMTERWEPVSDDDWRKAIGPGVPDRILNAQLKR